MLSKSLPRSPTGRCRASPTAPRASPWTLPTASSCSPSRTAMATCTRCCTRRASRVSCSARAARTSSSCRSALPSPCESLRVLPSRSDAFRCLPMPSELSSCKARAALLSLPWPLLLTLPRLPVFRLRSVPSSLPSSPSLTPRPSRASSPHRRAPSDSFRFLPIPSDLFGSLLIPPRRRVAGHQRSRLRRRAGRAWRLHRQR